MEWAIESDLAGLHLISIGAALAQWREDSLAFW